jgi:hypothetical protein
VGGVYGDQLSAFPELLKDYTVFKMRPRIGAGYGERYDIRSIAGYFSRLKSKEADIVGGTKVANDRATFYEQHDFRTGESRIKQFDYVEAKKRLWTFIEDDDMGDEGGFTKWTLQLVRGVTDQQQTNTQVDENIRNDYE